jgi:hypothetical protein
MPNMTLPEYAESQEQVVDKDREELRAAFKTLGYELPQKVHVVKVQHVIGYHQHPMIARHLKLAELMKANGKLPPLAGEKEA